jgi:hypothetical protein
MAIRLPQYRSSGAPRYSQSDDTQLILQTLGQNPYARAIEDLTPLISQALQRRAELKRQSSEIAALENIAKQPSGSFAGLSIPTASSIAMDYQRQNIAEAKEEENRAKNLQKIRSLESQFGYKPGELGENPDVAKLRVIQSEIGERRKGLEEIAQKREMAKEGTGFKNRLNTQKTRMINDPRIKPLYSQDIGLKQVEDIQKMVGAGNTIAAGALGVKMAKAMGEVGVLTDQDVQRYITSGQIDRMAADKLSKWIRGVPTEATQNEISQIAMALSGSFKEKIQPIYNEYIESFSNVEGKNPYEVSRLMAIPYTKSINTVQKLQQIQKSETPEQRKARLIKELSEAR